MSFFKTALTHSTMHSLIGCLFIHCLVAGQTIREDVRTHSNWKLLNREDNCGQSSSDRIIGGKTATLGQYPWIARVGYSDLTHSPCTNSPLPSSPVTSPTLTISVNREDNPDVTYTCGGTIISDRYVLTAAHCAAEFNFPDWLDVDITQVRLGEHDIRTDPDCQHGVCAPPVQDINVEDYYCHTGYNTEALQDDICLIRLASPIQFNRYVSPICLPADEWFQNYSLDEGFVEVAGWGINNIATKSTSDVLMTVTLPLVRRSRCEEEFNGQSSIGSHQLCAGGVIGTDSCTGDSGGPLMSALSVNSPPRYYLMGVVSFGDSNCGNTTSPAVYTKTADYLPWILDHIKE